MSLSTQPYQYSVQFVYRGARMTLLFYDFAVASTLLAEIAPQHIASKAPGSDAQACVAQQLASYNAAQPLFQNLTLAPDFRLFTNLRMLNGYQPVSKTQIAQIKVEHTSVQPQRSQKLLLACLLQAFADRRVEFNYRLFTGLPEGLLFDLALKASKMIASEPLQVQLQRVQQFLASDEKHLLEKSIMEELAKEKQRALGEKSVVNQEFSEKSLFEGSLISDSIEPSQNFQPQQPVVILKHVLGGQRLIPASVSCQDAILPRRYDIPRNALLFPGNYVGYQTSLTDKAASAIVDKIMEVLRTVKLDKIQPAPEPENLATASANAAYQTFTDEQSRDIDRLFNIITVRKIERQDYLNQITQGHMLHLIAQKSYQNTLCKFSTIDNLWLLLLVRKQQAQSRELPFDRYSKLFGNVKAQFAFEFCQRINFQSSRQMEAGFIRYFEANMPKFSQKFMQHCFLNCQPQVVRMLSLISVVAYDKNCYLRLLAQLEQHSEEISDYLKIGKEILPIFMNLVVIQFCNVKSEDVKFVGQEQFSFALLGQLDAEYHKIRHVLLADSLFEQMNLYWIDIRLRKPLKP